MADAQGVKETKEALVGLLRLSKVLAESFKDGVQAADFTIVLAKITGDAALQQALMDAYNGIDKVGTELGDLSLGEGFDLIQASIPEVLALVETLRK